MYTKAFHRYSGRMRAGGPRSQRQRVLVGARPTTDGLPPILGQDAGRRPALPAPAGVGRCSAHHRRPATNPRAGCGPEARAPRQWRELYAGSGKRCADRPTGERNPNCIAADRPVARNRTKECSLATGTNQDDVAITAATAGRYHTAPGRRA